MATRSLLSKAPIEDDHVFRIPSPAEAASPQEAAQKYTQTLATFFGIAVDGPPPAFDLILLGLGDDGHTASLFPGKPAVQENKAWLAASPPGVLPPPVDRVTFTFPVLNALKLECLFCGGAPVVVGSGWWI